MHIYSEESPYPIYTYEFFQEELSIFITFEGIGSTFLLSGNKLFKIIYNQRYELFSNEKIFNKDKITINYYQSNKKLSYPVFEFKPENIWNAYCISLGLEKIDFIDDEEDENIGIIINKDENRNYRNNRRLNSKNYNIENYVLYVVKKVKNVVLIVICVFIVVMNTLYMIFIHIIFLNVN